MEIRLKRDQLLAELAPMQGVVERRTTIPILSHLLLSVEHGVLGIAATDLDVSLTSSVVASESKEGALAVQAKKFIEIVRSMVGEELLLAVEGERSLRIEAGRSRFRMHGLPATDFPTLPKVESAPTLVIELQQLRRLVSKVLFAISTEDSRFQLSGALLKKRDGRVELVATDGHRLALIDTPVVGATGESAALVPRKALQEIVRLEGGGNLEMRASEHHLSFRSGKRELICRVLEGTFPDYDRVIARNHEKRVVCKRRLLADAVQRVALMTGERNRGVRINVAAGEIGVAAANPDLGEATETVAAEYTGGEVQIGLNPDYLVQFLAAVETDDVVLELRDENSQCVGRPSGGETASVDGERYLCVIMPMRV